MRRSLMCRWVRVAGEDSVTLGTRHCCRPPEREAETHHLCTRMCLGWRSPKQRRVLESDRAWRHVGDGSAPLGSLQALLWRIVSSPFVSYCSLFGPISAQCLSKFSVKRWCSPTQNYVYTMQNLSWFHNEMRSCTGMYQSLNTRSPLPGK